MRRLIAGALLVASGAILAPPAAAATKVVGFNQNDYIYLPDRVAIKAGESVTWNDQVSVEPHNVRFDDGQFTAPELPSSNRFTVSRTFSTNGVYTYFCEVHGRDMNGVVYVNATGAVPPDARFTVTPKAPVTGQAVTFDAQATRAGDAAIAKYEWDLDGDGLFELDTRTTRTASKSYLTAQELTARLKVTDVNGLSEEEAIVVGVAAAPAPPAPVPGPAPAPGPAPPPAPAPQPQPVPQITTSTDTRPATPASFTFRAASTASRAKGAVARVTCSGRCRVTATLSINRSVARRARLGNKAVTIGTARGTLTAAGSKTVRVKLTSTARRKLARFSSVRATLKLAVADASGKTTRKQKALLLKR